MRIEPESARVPRCAPAEQGGDTAFVDAILVQTFAFGGNAWHAKMERFQGNARQFGSVYPFWR